jgi:hypothetical protein
MPHALLLSLVLPAHADPAPGLFHGRTHARDLECERLAAEAASRRYPGRIVVSYERGREEEGRTVVVCRQRMLRTGLRAPRDEVILSTLETRVHELAVATASLRPDLREQTWLVEAFYPSPAVGEKLSFATKNALMGEGLTVSDRSPTLGAGDIDVLLRMPPLEAYPTACTRWSTTGALQPGDALLAVLILDPRETRLHAGVCTAGTWMWLQ